MIIIGGLTRILIVLIISINANAFVSERQYDYLSSLALALKVSDTCRTINLTKVNNRHLYKFIPIEIKTNGMYKFKTNFYTLINLCKEIEK